MPTQANSSDQPLPAVTAKWQRTSRDVTSAGSTATLTRSSLPPASAWSFSKSGW